MSENKRKKRLRIVLLVVAALTITGLAVAYSYARKIILPNVQVPGGKTHLYIATGSDENDVLDSLISMDVLKDPGSYQWLAEKKNYRGGNVVPGKYALTDGMSNNALINHLRAGNGRLEVTVQFNQLRTRQELAGRLAQNIEPDSLAVLNWLENPDSTGRYGFNSQTITTMFIPNSYRMSWDVSVPELMERMTREYKKFWNPERVAKAKAAGLTQSEVVTLASIVYWETKNAEDMPKVAGVYMNRLKAGMPLQADPTLIFALGDFGIKRVLHADKLIDSPYNTYKYAGLPPGPILIPPIAYVDAVLNYEKHDYYYFVAKEDFSGESYFSKNYAQHMIYARRYQKALSDSDVMR